MSSKQFPEQPYSHSTHDAEDLIGLGKAIQYASMLEVLGETDIQRIEVMGPDDHELLQKTFIEMLGREEDGRRLLSSLSFNALQIRVMQQEQGENFASLRINTDATDEGRGYSSEWKCMCETEELIDNPNQPNILFAGLQAITGAVILRDDIADSNGTGIRLYKGVFAENPVYFLERILPKVVYKKGKETTTYCRFVEVGTEEWAEKWLGSLSDEDIELLKELNIPLPVNNCAKQVNRSWMLDMIRFYVEANGHSAD